MLQLPKFTSTNVRKKLNIESATLVLDITVRNASLPFITIVLTLILTIL